MKNQPGASFLCGFVAGLVWGLLSIFVLVVVGGDFLAAVPGGRLYAPRGGLQAFLLSVDFAWSGPCTSRQMKTALS